MASTKEIDWYETPLYYDIIFDADTAVEADFLEAMHTTHGTNVAQPSNLEIACGTGRVLRELASRGWVSAGFDASEAMLEFAWLRNKQEGRKANLWTDRMESFQVPNAKKFDLIHCLVSTFKYLPNEQAATGCLKCSSTALKKGGLLVIGLHLTDYGNSRPTHERWDETRNGIEVVCNTRTWPANKRRRTEQIRSRLRITHEDGQIKTQETHWEGRTYSAGQLKLLLKAAPELDLVAVHDFNHDPEISRELDDSYSDVVVVLKKK